MSGFATNFDTLHFESLMKLNWLYFIPFILYTIQYNTTQYNTTQYNTIQYNTIQYNTIQYNTTQCIEPYGTHILPDKECMEAQYFLLTFVDGIRTF